MTPTIRNISIVILTTLLFAGTTQAAPSNAATIDADGRPVPQLSQRDLNERFWLNALSGNVAALTQLVEMGANPRLNWLRWVLTPE